MRDEEESEDHGDAGTALEEAGKGAAEALDVLAKAREGDVLGAIGAGVGSLGSGAGAVASALGADDAEVRSALESAAHVASATSAAFEAVGELAGGRHGGELEGSAPRSETQEPSRHLGREEDLLCADEVFGDSGVSYHLEVSGTDIPWAVHTVSIIEGLSEPYHATVDSLFNEHPFEESELLGKRFVLTIERGTRQQRILRGVVRQCRIRHVGEGYVCHLVLAPSCWLLSLGVDSRIFQDVTVPDLVTRIVRDTLGDACCVDAAGLTETYERHEYLVQYQESSLNFVRRLLELEGSRDGTAPMARWGYRATGGSRSSGRLRRVALDESVAGARRRRRK